MATIKHSAWLNGKPMTALIDSWTFELRGHGAKHFTIGDESGARLEVQGSGFDYVHGKATAGTITTATLFDASGHVLISVNGAQVDAAQVFHDLGKYHVTALYWTLASGNDRVIGSNVADYVQGDHGDDIVNGRGGDDRISGYGGDDTLIGGAGADRFIFSAWDDIDTIRDFDDSGAEQDVIWLQTKGLWKQMHKQQQGDDVLLDFGDGDQLIIEHAKASDITRADFILS